MSLSICEVLSESLLGGGSSPLDWDEFSEHLRDNYLNSESEKARVARHRRRQEFYQDGGQHHVRELIEKVMIDKDVVNLRTEWVEAACFNNTVRRIVNERSTVYQDPAKRQVKGDSNNKKYNDLQVAMRQHERSRQWNRLSNLHRTILVAVRVRNIGTQSVPVPQPVFDIITPAEIAGLITSPKDPTRLEGAIIEIKSTQGRKNTNCPHFIVWTNMERVFISKDGEVLNVVEHGLGRMPLVLLRLEEDTGSLWPGMAGEDLISAQMSLAFAQVCLLKEMKSATKQTILSGDLAPAARRQAADTEMPIEMPEGAIATVHDMSMDLSLFRDTANHILDTVASNYGIAPSVLRHQGVQSAEARDLMRVPIRELRLEQHAPLREFERELAIVQSIVMAHDAPEYSFDPSGWSVDFADPQTPRGTKQQLEEFEQARRLQLTSTYKHVSRQNPDLDIDAARDEIVENIGQNTEFQVLLRPYAQAAGGVIGGATPAQTGDESDDDSEGRNTAPPASGREEDTDGKRTN